MKEKIYALQKEYAKSKFLENKGEDYKKAFIDSNYLYHVGDIVLPISNDAAAIVPTAMCLELPKTAYTNGGTKLESDILQ